jgi:lysophospholipase L1-like esterase
MVGPARWWHRVVLALGPVLVSTVLPALASAGTPAAAGRWFTAWSRPQSIAVAGAASATEGGQGPGPLVDQSVRDIIRLTASGTAVRIRLSNRYGAGLSPEQATPLQVTAATVGRRSRGADVLGRTLRAVTFGGRADVTIPGGATVISDPILSSVLASGDLAVSLHVGLAPVAPAHGASFVTSYLTPIGAGDHTHDPSGSAYSQRTTGTLVLTAVDVLSTRVRGVVATTGGSVVDGFGSDVDRYDDWPSWLSRRVRGTAVVNNGLGGTTAAAACALPPVGPSLTGPSVEQRVGHDSLGLAGITHLIVYAGTNDIGNACTADRVIDAFRSIARQAHARGVKVLISTITPRGSYSAAQNAEREKVNAWVRSRGRCGGECDRSLDFDVVVRDPADPNRIDPRLDSGDGIHPNGEGYRRIAAVVPLDALR